MYRSIRATIWAATIPLIGCQAAPPEDLPLVTPPDPKSRFLVANQKGEVLLAANQILEYRWDTHTLVVMPGVDGLLRKSLQRSDLIGGVPFVVIADGVPSYSGVFTTSYSSLSQDCPVIDVEPVEKQPYRITIQLGYPSRGFFRGEDPRGHERIRNVLQDLGKLRE